MYCLGITSLEKNVCIIYVSKSPTSLVCTVKRRVFGIKDSSELGDLALNKANATNANAHMIVRV